MSMIVTEPPRTAYTRRLESPSKPAENPVRVLLGKMRAAVNALPQQHREKVLQDLKDWETIFFANYRMDSQLDDDRINAAHAILFLRFNNIEYIMHNYAGSVPEKVQWLQIHNDLKSIVGSILPAGLDLETFIKADQKKQLEIRLHHKMDSVVKEIMQNINALFARMEEGLYEKGDGIARDLDIEFKAIEKLLSDLNNERKEESNEIHGEIDRLTETVTRICQETERQLNVTEELTKKIHVQEAALSLLLDECQAVIDKK